MYCIPVNTSPTIEYTSHFHNYNIVLFPFVRPPIKIGRILHYNSILTDTCSRVGILSKTTFTPTARSNKSIIQHTFTAIGNFTGYEKTN